MPLKAIRCLRLLCLLGMSAAAATLPAQEKKAEATAETGPWLSAIAWLDDANLVATKSEGLLLRPAQVVKLTAADPAKLETVGEQETSLWSILPVGGNKFVVSDYKGGVYLYGDGEPKKFAVDARWVRALAKAPGEGEILVGTEDGKLVVLALNEQKEARRIDAHAAAIFGIAVSHSGDKIATAAGDGTIKIFSWPKLDPLATMSRGKDAVWCVAFSADDSQLISGGADRRIQLWDLAKQKSVMSLQTTSDWITSVVALPDTTAIAASSMSGKVFVVDYKTMLPVTHTDAMKSAIWSMTLSPDHKHVALGSRKSGAMVMPIAEWVAAAKQAAESEAAKEMAPSPKKK